MTSLRTAEVWFAQNRAKRTNANVSIYGHHNDKTPIPLITPSVL